MTTPTTAEQTEPAIKWAQSLLHHAAFPDPVSQHCAIPAREVEAAARYLASVERENEDARATIARLEGELSVLRPVVNRDMPVAAEHIGEILAENRALRTRADAAERRVEALVALVREAYEEGWNTGTWENRPDALNAETLASDWEVSTTRAALAAAPGAADGAATTED